MFSEGNPMIKNRNSLVRVGFRLGVDIEYALGEGKGKLGQYAMYWGTSSPFGLVFVHQHLRHLH